MQINEIDIQNYTKISQDRRISFMQSFEWAVFKSHISDYTYKFFEIVDTKQGLGVIGSFMGLIKPKKILGININILYIPKCIFFKESKDNTPENISEVLNYLKKSFSLILVEFNTPYWEDNFEMNEVQRKEYINILSYLSSFNPTSLEIQPSSTIVNDVTNINDLEKFISTLQSKSCKRNIKKALSYMEDNSISFVVKESLNDNELTEAYSLFKEVASHGNFKGRPFEYYKSLQETLPSKVIWYLMMKDGHIILANLAVRDLNTKTSNDLYVGKKMELEEGAISYGLKYLSFKYLNENGYKYYDHWGIYLDPKSPKFGFSEFKLKFEGKIINFLPVFAYSKFVPSFFINFIIKVFSNVNF